MAGFFLYLLLVSFLGLLVGAAVECLLTSYMQWVRRKQPRPTARVWRYLFGIVIFPVLVYVGAAAGIQPGLLSDQTEAGVYLVAFTGGVIGSRGVRLWLRRRS